MCVYAPALEASMPTAVIVWLLVEVRVLTGFLATPSSAGFACLRNDEDKAGLTF
jgi:hypothetical protein